MKYSNAESNKNLIKKYPSIGVCGLDCGLCPKEFFSRHLSCKKVMWNLNFIKTYGIGKFMEQQECRIKLLETMIENFDDGRSRSFFCKAAALHEVAILSSSIEKATRKINTDNTNRNDTKTKAKIFKEILYEMAL